MREISPDVLTTMTHAESVKIVFYTDKDSIACALKPKESFKFYVLLGDTAYALTELKAIPFEAVKYDKSPRPSYFKFQYEKNIDN